MNLTHLKGYCCFCSKETTPYNPGRHRHCCTEGISKAISDRFADDVRLYPTVFPIPAAPDKVFAPPDPWATSVPDVFVVAHGSKNLTAPPGNALPALPYPTGSTLMQHLRCGNATLYPLRDSAVSLAFKEMCITVCDFTTYVWSNTLKDPRSWAVIATAVEYGIKHLGVWTAGNAGLSLAKLAYTVNLHLPAKDRINIYCYSKKGSLPQAFKSQLQSFGAHVATFGSSNDNKIFSPDDALRHLNASLDTRIEHEEYWDVTDGWDGVGLYMYRLLGRQICLHVRPDYIVVPLGTGDLFFGLYLGREDCRRSGQITQKDCHIVGALPAGQNIRTTYESYHLNIPIQGCRADASEPIAPKLATAYTPLLLAMYPALHDECVTVMETSAEDQDCAAKQFFSRGAGPLVAAEPSALLAFAVLRKLAAWNQEHGETRSRCPDAKSRVMVVNSGCGLMGPSEQSFLSKYLQNSSQSGL